MSDARSPTPVGVLVVGGGISGLAAAWSLGRLTGSGGPEVRLVESSPRLGGLIRTDRIDGVLVEGGPDSLVTHKPAGLELCGELGLDDELVLPPSRSPALEIFLRGRLVGVPRELAMLAPARLHALWTCPLFSWRGKLRLAVETLVPRGREQGDESLRAFIERRFGREAFERLAEPVFGGLFTADADRLSAETTLGRLRALERAHGSVRRGMARAAPVQSGGAPPLVSLSGGMGRLAERLVESLPPGRVATGVEVTGLLRDATTGEFVVRAADDRAWSARAVILACPAFVASPLVRNVDPGLADELDAVEYASCATVNLVYRREQISRPPRSFGFFVPRSERLPILACSYVSARFRDRVPDGSVLLRVFLGGALAQQTAELAESRLAELAHETLVQAIGATGEPSLAHVTRVPRSMPQQNVGYGDHLGRIEQALDRVPGLFLGGGALGAVGLPDCIRIGRRAAERAHEHVVHGSRRLELAI